MHSNREDPAMHPRFITLEGGEGSGKSTQALRIRDWLAQQGHSVCLTRQPGGTPLAEQIRRLLKDAAHLHMSPDTELLLLFAARAQFLAEVVRPALDAGQVVVCDRFTDSTWAYQGGGRGMAASDITALEELVHGDLQPGLTLLLDLDVQEGLRRVASRGEADRFEREALPFFERVREAYLERARRLPGRYVVIDASGDADGVWSRIRPVLEQRPIR